VIVIFRVCGRYIRSEKLFREDWLAFGCLVPMFIRMAVVHVVLLYGTNNAITTGLSAENIMHRETGSKMVLVSRIFYAATLWMLKLTISEFFKRLTANVWTRSHEMMLMSIRWFLLITFLAVVIADLAECQPFSHYWQVVPNPGAKCRQGYAQLLTMGTVNVITDLLLVIFPIPIIIKSQMGMKRKIQLVLLFSASLLPAGTTLYRIPKIIDRDGSQQYRSLLASIEILFATAVANALVLGSFVRDRGVKKQRWKFGSMTDSMERTASRRGTATRHWGSDEDLVRGLGLGVDPDLRDSAPTPRPAPMAVSGNAPSKRRSSDWHFAGERSDTSDEIDFMKGDQHSQADMSSIMGQRKVSFFDVGGLLEGDQPSQRSTRTLDTDAESSTFSAAQSNYSHELGGLSPPSSSSPRKGSSAFLQDIGGLLGPKTSRQQPTRGYELQTIHQERSPQITPVHAPVLSRQHTAMSLQDVGGLLK